MLWILMACATLVALVGTAWGQWRHLGLAWLCLGMLPLGLYGFMGMPAVPSVPAGVESPVAAARVAELTAILRNDPENVAVWAELASRHAAARRWDKAEAAFRGALVIAPHVPQLQAGLGEVLINRAGGMVPAEAEDLFSAVLNVETKNLAALYYLGLAALQRQDDVGARAYWQILAERAPQDAPWYRDFMMNYTALMADGA